MSIARYEPIIINNIIRTPDATGDATPTYTLFYNTVALVSDIKNTLEFKDRYRLYTDLSFFQINYSPNAEMVAISQENYAIVWRNFIWRIADTYESNDRKFVKLFCYLANPTVRA